MKVNPFFDHLHVFQQTILESTVAEPKKLLICGNSQMGNGGTGQALESIFKKKGWFVHRCFKNGMDTNGLLQMLRSYSPAMKISYAYDAAIFCSGGANGTKDIQQNSIEQILQLFPQKTMKFWMGISPRTKDQNGNFDQANAFLREQSNVLLGNFVSKHCVFIDWKSLGLQGNERTPGTNILFPRLYDGIHLTGNSASAAANGIWEHMNAAFRQAMNVKQNVPFKASAKPVEASIEKRREEVLPKPFGDPDEEFALSDDPGIPPGDPDSSSAFEEEEIKNLPPEQKEEHIASGGNEEISEHVLASTKKGKIGIISDAVYDAIVKASANHNVPAETMFAIAKYESGFNPNAKSGHSSASGLFQFLRSYAGFDRFDPYASADAAAKILKGNLALARSYGQGDWFAYFCHQQGRYGAKTIWNSATEMIPLKSKTIISNIANNFGLPKSDKNLIFAEKNADLRWKLFVEKVQLKYPKLSEKDILPFFCKRLKVRYESVKLASQKSVQKYLSKKKQ